MPFCRLDCGIYVIHFIDYIKETNAKVVWIDETIEPIKKNQSFDDKIHWLIDDVEFKEGIKEYLKTIQSKKVHTLEDLNHINDRIHEHNSKNLERINKLRLDLNSPQYKKALKANTIIKRFT